MTQKEAILNYIEEHGSITPKQAIYDLGITRLAAYIHDLREEGYNIETERITVKTKRYGKTSVARYYLV